ncbi:hypothetical protein BN2537_8211 [Streptomyces venezuelae]|nr:hypothetical protein BN2537_8211 [Streptomyces venezuelae]
MLRHPRPIRRNRTGQRCTEASGADSYGDRVSHLGRSRLKIRHTGDTAACPSLRSRA